MMDMNRRDFLKATGVSSTALIFGIQLPMAGRKALAAGENGFTHHYVMIGKQPGEFVFTMDKAEMGQGVITGQLTMFCEEFDLDPARMKVVPAPVAEIYGTMAGQQITGGSTSTKERFMVLRQAGANVRGVLLRAASQKWGVPVSELKTENGVVTNAAGDKTATYNELVESVADTKIEDQKLKSPDAFKYIGKTSDRADALEKSTGQADYGMDFQIEGLLTAIVVRPPSFGGSYKKFNDEEVKKLPGIQHVVGISSGVAIVADKYWQLLKARNFLQVQWEAGPNGDVSSEKIKGQYKALLAGDGGKEAHSKGEIGNVLAETGPESLLEAEYELPYLAHSCMEPMNAAAHVKEDSAEIWVPTQSPTLIRNWASDFLGMSRDDVKVHNAKYLGGGFGRRSTLDYPKEAVELSQKLKAPVKVVWSRADDTKHSPMRPFSLHKMTGVVKGGKAVAWEHRLACESIMQQTMPQWIPLMMPAWLPGFVKSGIGSTAGALMDWTDTNMVTAEGAKIDYAIPNVKVRLNEADIAIPIHFWRAVGHSYNGFVVESFVDEMAHKAEKDPYQFRRDLLKDTPRAVGVLDKVAQMAGWDQPAPKGVHRGIAYHFSFESYVAQVAEVEVVDSAIKVKKVYCAVDCGVAVNPDIIKDQMMSGIVYGLSATLHGEITVQNGAIRQGNFDDYPVMRMNESPEIEVAIINSSEPPTGVGEPGLPPVAAAVANAVFAGTGKRLRKLPLKV